MRKAARDEQNDQRNEDGLANRKEKTCHTKGISQHWGGGIREQRTADKTTNVSTFGAKGKGKQRVSKQRGEGKEGIAGIFFLQSSGR